MGSQILDRCTDSRHGKEIALGRTRLKYAAHFGLINDYLGVCRRSDAVGWQRCRINAKQLPYSRLWPTDFNQ